ncbi:MAG: pyridoxamine 5'-phosphate oxidase, partial [Bacteroidetes bacterium]|nr:pyridoxamine 5'-phosphate oxidase [Bacteroidota bacterium]
LLKEFCEKNGFVFYTNYDSRKARQLEDNSRAALLFWWPRTGRQVRVEGNVGRVSGEESDRYFSSRPEESRLGAWASEQSREIASGKVLEERIMRFRKEFRGIIPRPPHWGGYRLAPERIEFWQEGEHRLHSRLLYIREGEGWTFKRLAP